EDDAVVRQPAHPFPHGIDALAAAVDEIDVAADPARVLRPAEKLAGVIHHVGGDDDDDVVDRLGTFDGGDGTLDQAAAAQLDVGLRDGFTQSRAAAGGGDEGGDPHLLVLGVEVDGLGFGGVVGRGRTLGVEGAVALDGGLDAGEELGGLLLVNALGEGKLADEDLAGLAQHALLARGQAAILVAAPQVTDDFGDLVDVAGAQALLVGLVTAGPVAGLLHVGFAQDGENLPQPVLSHDVADADQLSVLRGDLNVQVTLQNLEDEVLNDFAVQFPFNNLLNFRVPVVRVDDGIVDAEFTLL